MGHNSGGVFVQIDRRMANGLLFLTRIDAGEDGNAAARGATGPAAAQRRRVRRGRRAAHVGDAQRRVLVQRVAPA